MFSAILFALSLASAAAAPAGCASPASPAPAVSLKAGGPDGQQNAKMLVSAAMLLGVAKADAAHARAASEGCRFGTFQAAGATWELSGGDRGFVRRALAADTAKPVAFLYPFADLAALIEATKTHAPPPPTRFVLATASGATVTIWRAYESLPADAQLQTDLVEVLSDKAAPVAAMDVSTQQITLMKGALGD